MNIKINKLRGGYLFSVGLLMLVLGFIALTRVDARAENIWGFVAPLLLVSSYIVMAISFLL